MSQRIPKIICHYPGQPVLFLFHLSILQIWVKNTQTIKKKSGSTLLESCFVDIRWGIIWSTVGWLLEAPSSKPCSSGVLSNILYIIYKRWGTLMPWHPGLSYTMTCVWKRCWWMGFWWQVKAFMFVCPLESRGNSYHPISLPTIDCSLSNSPCLITHSKGKSQGTPVVVSVWTTFWYFVTWTS